MMIRIASCLALAVALIAADTAMASSLGQTIAEQGAGQAPPCSSCHGASFEGNPAVKAPALAGRPADYIVARLAHYASPEGHNALMKQVATALSPAQRTAVATYLSSLKPTPNPAAGATATPGSSPGRLRP
jgi:cytochrome c553